MTAKKDCEVCGEYSGKRRVCKDCKVKYPYKAAPSQGGRPFNRHFEHYKDQIKKVKKK